jgi:uncharacterized caspase-like protein
MKKLLSIVLVCFFSAYLLSACTTTIIDDIPGDPKQQALVIGNADYQKNPLTNPVNDAADMAKSLIKQGFSVALRTNLDRKKMADAIREFKKRLFAHKKSVGLFYFSGHGAQVEGKNYLMPVNNDKIKFDDEVPWRAVEVDKILAQMQGTNNGLNIMILDACRNNPYPSRPPKGDGKDGLAPITPPEGVIIGYATAPGRTVPDFGERNSLYTKHLLKAIQPQKRIDDVFIEVYDPVRKESNQKQIPWYHASINKPFCFGGCP